MIIVKAQLKSVSPYSQSKHYDVPKLNDEESPRDYEHRTWRERCHRDHKTKKVLIPPMAFKKALEEGAKHANMKIEGEGQAKYTKHFERGVAVLTPVVLSVKVDDVEGEWLFVPSNGVTGAGKRVSKCFPLIPEWEGTVVFHILDDKITEAIFKRALEAAGKFIGIGRFRPINRGYYGRFEVVSISWQPDN